MSCLGSPLIYFLLLDFIESTWTGMFFDFSIVAFPLPPMVNVYCCFEKFSKKTKAHIKIINRTAPITLWVIPCKYDLPKEIGLIGSIAFLISSIWFLFILSSMSRFVSSREFSRNDCRMVEATNLYLSTLPGVQLISLKGFKSSSVGSLLLCSSLNLLMYSILSSL